MNRELEEWIDATIEKLHVMITDWESRIPPEEDDTFYSLALRRAIDVVKGSEPDLGPRL